METFPRYWFFVRRIHQCMLYLTYYLHAPLYLHGSTLIPAVSTVPTLFTRYMSVPLQWRHNERVGISNHQLHNYLLNRVFKTQITENIKAPRRWPLCGEFTGNRWIRRTKGASNEKMFPIDDVIMHG